MPKLTLELLDEAEPEFEGWVVSAGSKVQSSGAGVLLIVSPETRKAIEDGTIAPWDMARVIRHHKACFERAMRQVLNLPAGPLTAPEPDDPPEPLPPSSLN